MNAPAMTSTTFVPLRLAGRPLAVKVAAVFLGSLFLAASSWIEVPMFPVPMTMQTFAVTLVGALYGWRLGLATVLAWLGEAALGAPVLAGGAVISPPSRSPPLLSAGWPSAAGPPRAAWSATSSPCWPATLSSWCSAPSCLPA